MGQSAGAAGGDAWAALPARVIRASRRVVRRYGAPLLGGLLLLLAAWFLLRGRGEVARLGRSALRADPWWLLGSALLEGVVLALIVGKYRLLLRRLGRRLGAWPLLRAHLRRHVVAAIVPVGGPPSMYVFARDLARGGIPLDDGVYAVVLYSLIGHVSFVLFLLPVLGWIALTRHLSGNLALGAALLVVLLGVLLAPLIWLDRTRGARLLPARARAFLERAHEHGVRARNLLGPLALAGGVHLANAAMLYCCLRAVGQRPALATTLAGYAVGTMFGLLAPLYQGAGVVELTMAGALHHAGLPLDIAVAATLLYRLTQFWLPLAVGALVQLRLPRLPRAAIALPAAAMAISTAAVSW